MSVNSFRTTADENEHQRAIVRREKIAAEVNKSASMHASVIAMALRFHGEQLAKDADEFANAPGHERIAVEQRGHAEYLIALADEIEGHS